jgi:hypothetical protein
MIGVRNCPINKNPETIDKDKGIEFIDANRDVIKYILGIKIPSPTPIKAIAIVIGIKVLETPTKSIPDDKMSTPDIPVNVFSTFRILE